jgi:hypothetical protein
VRWQRRQLRQLQLLPGAPVGRLRRPPGIPVAHAAACAAPALAPHPLAAPPQLSTRAPAPRPHHSPLPLPTERHLPRHQLHHRLQLHPRGRLQRRVPQRQPGAGYLLGVPAGLPRQALQAVSCQRLGRWPARRSRSGAITAYKQGTGPAPRKQAWQGPSAQRRSKTGLKPHNTGSRSRPKIWYAVCCASGWRQGHSSPCGVMMNDAWHQSSAQRQQLLRKHAHTRPVQPWNVWPGTHARFWVAPKDTASSPF